ncbi:MAG: hypothetical protein Q9191_008474, partial [Dirinaria sp. TL-2023a]
RLSQHPHDQVTAHLLKTHPQNPPKMRPPKILVPTPTSAPLPPKLNAKITSALLSQTTCIPKLQESLVAECQNVAWLDKIKERSLQLFREDEDRDYDEVMRILVEEARGGRDETRQKEGQRGESGNGKKVDVTIPVKAIDEAIRIVSEGLGNIVEFEGQGV